METAVEIPPDRASGGPVFYMNRTARRLLRKQERLAVATGGGITYDNVDGRRVMQFSDVPIRICDALLNNEALVP